MGTLYNNNKICLNRSMLHKYSESIYSRLLQTQHLLVPTAVVSSSHSRPKCYQHDKGKFVFETGGTSKMPFFKTSIIVSFYNN